MEIISVLIRGEIAPGYSAVWLYEHSQLIRTFIFFNFVFLSNRAPGSGAEKNFHYHLALAVARGTHRGASGNCYSPRGN